MAHDFEEIARRLLAEQVALDKVYQPGSEENSIQHQELNVQFLSNEFGVSPRILDVAQRLLGEQAYLDFTQLKAGKDDLGEEGRRHVGLIADFLRREFRVSAD